MADLRKKAEVTLIGEQVVPVVSNRMQIAVYVGVKLLPFLVYYIIQTYFANPDFAIVLFLAAQVAEFLVIKKKCGWSMVGISWRIEPEQNGSIVQFATKPAPYVPQVELANTFWMGFMVSIILWGIAFFAAFLQKRLSLVLLTIIGLLTQIANMTMFMKGQRAAQMEAANIARTAILDGSIQFALVEDDPWTANESVEM